MHVKNKYAGNFHKHGHCPYERDSNEYKESLSLWAKDELGLSCVEGFVPQGEGSGFAFPLTSGGSTSHLCNLEVLVHDLTYLFSRIGFAFHGKDEDNCIYNVDYYPMKLICLSQKDAVRSVSNAKNFNNTHVKTLWKKVIVHLGWMVTMNRSHFPKPGGHNMHFSAAVLKKARVNCIRILRILKSCIRCGHNGKFFLEHFANDCWPEMAELSVFENNNCESAYKAAYNSWKTQIGRIKTGLVGSFEHKFNPQYWNDFWTTRPGQRQNIRTEKTPAWVFEGWVYFLFDYSTQITSGYQMRDALMKDTLQHSYADLKHWGSPLCRGSYDDWFKVEKEMYMAHHKIQEVGKQEMRNHIKHVLTEGYAEIRSHYQHNTHFASLGDTFPLKDARGNRRFMVWGTPSHGWRSFFEAAKHDKMPKARMRFQEYDSATNVLIDRDNVWDRSDMLKHAKAWQKGEVHKPEDEVLNVTNAKPPAGRLKTTGLSDSDNDSDEFEVMW